MTGLTTPDNPFRVAIVGSGPAGFYAAEALLKAAPGVRVDMFERLASPFGLVRSGVAPDHPRLKEAIGVYRHIAEQPQLRYFGNVTVGRDITVTELLGCCHAVVLACGAQSDRTMDIPGEELPGSHAATAFVGWYNGHPDYRDRVFDLSGSTAVIVGHGNVAVDVCRILAKTVDELRHSDIAAHALEVLADSRIRDIVMIGRRGPAQARFTHPELRELGTLADCDPVVDPHDLELDAAGRAALADRSNRAALKACQVLQEFAARGAPAHRRRCRIAFLKSPIALRGGDRVERVVLMRNRLDGEPPHQVAEATGDTEELACSIVFRSIGYRGVAMPGVPFDARAGVIPNRDGRVTANGAVVPGLYVAGWIKRGATGIIGTNREDSVLTIDAVLADLARSGIPARPDADVLATLLKARGVRVVSYADWQKIDAAEVRRGEAAGKPREKFTRLSDMLEVLARGDGASPVAA